MARILVPLLLAAPPLGLFLLFLAWGAGEHGPGLHAHYGFNNDNFRFMFAKLGIIRQALLGGEFSFWNPLQSYGVDLWGALSKDSLLIFLLPWVREPASLVLFGCLHLAIAQLLFYAFGRELGLSRRGACVAALTFGGCGYFAVYLYDHSILGTVMWCVGILACFLAWRRRPGPAPLAFGAFCVGLALSFGRPTDFVYFLIFFAAWQVEENRDAQGLSWPGVARDAGAMLLMGLLGLVLAAPFVVPFIFHLAGGARGLPDSLVEASEYVRFDHLHGLLLPTWQTGARLFLPLAAWPLARIGLRHGGSRARFLAWSCLAVILMIAPLGLFDLLRLLPGHEGARSPIRFFPILAIAFAALAGMGFDAVLRPGGAAREDRLTLRRAFAAGTILGLVTLAASLLTAHTEWPIWSALGLKTKDIQVRLGWGSWVVLVLSLAAWRAAARDFRKFLFPLFVLAILPAVWLVSQDSRAMLRSDGLLREYYGRLEGSETLARLRERTGHEFFRVHVPDESLGGTLTFWSGHGLDMDYGYEAAERSEAYLVKMRLFFQGKGNRGWFDVGNVRYLICESGKAPEWLRHQYPLAWDDTRAGLEVYENPGVWPRTFVTSRVLVEPDAGRREVILGTPGLVPRESAMLQSPLDFPLDPGARGTARIVRRGFNEVEIRAESSGPALLVYSETLAPGWSATLDGRPAAIVPVNVLFRGVALPGGEHSVRFSYRPKAFDLACGLCVGGLAVVGGLFLAARRRRSGS